MFATIILMLIAATTIFLYVDAYVDEYINDKGFFGNDVWRNLYAGTQQLVIVYLVLQHLGW